MSEGFRRIRGSIELRLTHGEAGVLRELLENLLQLLDPTDAAGGGPAPADPLEAIVGFSAVPAERPADPVLARLLPDAYADDPEASADFRRYTEMDLRAAKTAAARTALAGLQSADRRRLTLSAEGGEAWLTALNDIRLALGTRLGVTEESDAEPVDPRNPRASLLQVYGWLGWLQESLVIALAGW
ncbi:MAG: DUF2017 domain-containing protein [Actinomycetota bacterium]|nr:DUF2017 domain-containing protein [Actinomycetota bacterium]